MIQPEMGNQHRLHRVLAPKRIAIIGAKEDGRLFMGTGAVLQTLERVGFDGELHLVNRLGTAVAGRSASTSLAEAGARIDMAAVLVPAEAIPVVLPDVLRAGAAGATLLASGLAESGPQGVELQSRIDALALEYEAELIGPNCLGFVNFVERTGVWFSGLPNDVQQGHVAILSQSGGVGDALMEAAVNLGIGLSHVVTTGNEPTLAVVDILEYLLEQPATRAVAVFAEAIRKPDVFVRAAARARELGKAIVIVKAGSSELGARNAVTHTGSLAGDDATSDAVFAQLGVIRATSLEELIVTAHLAATIGALRGSGLGVVSLSGGGCSLIADAAEVRGLRLPPFDSKTTDGLRKSVGTFATVQNPFDITAAAGSSTFEEVIQQVSEQEDISIVAVLCNIPTHESGATKDVESLLRSVSRGMRVSSVPTVLISQTMPHGAEFGRRIAKNCGVETVLPGIEFATMALAHLASWSMWLSTQPAKLLNNSPYSGIARGATVLSEWDSRLRLGAAGIPLVPGELAETSLQAVAAWQRFAGPVAIKGVSADVPHKSDVGAVVLGVDDEVDVIKGFGDVKQAIAEAGGHAEGVLVTPMESGGVELVAGVTRDAVWGPTLVVGFGGVLVEVLKDSATRVLPVHKAEIAEMLRELRAYPLLAGVRGRPGLDIDSLIEVLLKLAVAGAEPDVLSLEVNPLLVRSRDVIALDALVELTDNRAGDGS